jgi:hypothetical protein
VTTLALLLQSVRLLERLAPADGAEPSPEFCALAASVEALAHAVALECASRPRPRRQRRGK